MSPERETAQEYIARMRAEGRSDDEIAGALRAAGWSDQDVRIVLAGGPPPPPPPPGSAAAPARGSRNTGLIVACLIVAGMMVFVLPILAAILFPVFARAREKARQTSCMSHVKQIGLACSAYAADHEDVLPAAERWPELMAPHLPDSDVLICPADDAPFTWERWSLSYAMNADLGAVGLVGMEAPAETIAFYDGTQLVDTNGGAGDPRHNGGLNVGFVDTHVTWMTTEEMRSYRFEP